MHHTQNPPPFDMQTAGPHQAVNRQLLSPYPSSETLTERWGRAHPNLFSAAAPIRPEKASVQTSAWLLALASFLNG